MPLSSAVRAAAFAACLTLLISPTIPGQPPVPDSPVADEMWQALLAVAAEYPDEPVVLWRTVEMHRSADEDELARRMAEDFTSRYPGDAGGYNVLFGLLKPEAEDRHPVLRRWAEATPGSGALVKAWMGSDLPEADPQATGELIERFFASQPADRSGIGGCIGLLDASATAVVEKASRCVSRILREPGLPPSVVQVIRSELAWSHPQVLASLMSKEDASPAIRNYLNLSQNRSRGDGEAPSATISAP